MGRKKTVKTNDITPSSISGEKFDEYLTTLLNAPKQSQYCIAVDDEDDWKTNESGDPSQYKLIITLWGTCYDGYCPKVYFVDEDDNQKYIMNYSYVPDSTDEEKAVLTIYSNIKMAGKIVLQGTKLVILKK